LAEIAAAEEAARLALEEEERQKQAERDRILQEKKLKI
jgi:hypothetical protein